MPANPLARQMLNRYRNKCAGAPKSAVQETDEPQREMKMLKNRIFALAAVFTLVGIAACADDGAIEDDAMVVDTMVTPEVETIEVPVIVPDTAIVTRDVDVDVDTVDVPDEEPLEPIG